MALQNRVTPHGDIIKHPARGTFMGNRGNLHNHGRDILRSYKIKEWITCLLSYKGEKRTLMSPGQYTELFFLDEATALAAGHRPCGQCRRARFNEFKKIFLAANADLLPDGANSVKDIDQVLHAHRIDASKVKVTYQADDVGTLPSGTFVNLDGQPHLLQGKILFPWQPEGYGKGVPLNTGTNVTVLTPLPIVRVLAAGYHADLHDSAI